MLCDCALVLCCSICWTLNAFFGLKAYLRIPYNTTYRNNVNPDLTSMVAMERRASIIHSITLANKLHMLTVSVNLH